MAQRPITLVSMMINSCSYVTNDLVFIKFQILIKILVGVLASIKRLKVKTRSYHALIQVLAFKDRIKYLRWSPSRLDRVLDRVDLEKRSIRKLQFRFVS